MNRTAQAVVAFLLLGAGCGDRGSAPAPAFLNVQGDALYVGNDACFACHEEESRGFAEHGMGRSMHALTPDRMVERFPSPPVRDAATGLEYRALLRDGRPVQEERLTDPDGREVHRLVRPMEIVMGSGNAARTYFWSDGGWLMQLPLTWYTRAGRWAFSPGYDVANGRFGRTVPDRCMACHNGIPEPIPQTNGAYASFPEGITCERCHGPGSLHVDERQATPEPDGPVDATIVNPAHLPFERRMDVCQQCHLSGAVSVLRSGRTAYGYLPGQALSDQVAVFSEPGAEGEGIAVISHVERLEASACFTGSDGTLECTTCHDPHANTPAPEVFGAVCLSCHGSGSLPADGDHREPSTCTGCHMPEVNAEETPHASFTDHRIRVVGSEEPAAAGTDHILLPYFDGESEQAEGMGLVVLGRQRRDPELVQAGRKILSSLKGDLDGEANLLLGLSILDAGDPESAIAPLEAALVDDPEGVDRLNALAQAYQATRRPDANVERLYRRALALQPARADVRLNLGQFLESRGRSEEALEEYLAAAEEAPWQALALFNAGTVLARLGRTGEALTTLRRALHLDPTLVEAWGNLGALLVAAGQVDSARTAFERAVGIAPDSPLALANLGALHVNLEQSAEAIPLLRRAVTVKPDYADAWSSLALALFRVDSLQGARAAAERAVAVDPENALARQVLLATE